MHLTEAEDVKRWQEYTEQLYKNLQDPDNHNGVITHLERDTPEEAAGDQESEDDLSASRTSLERQAPHRGNTMVHVCWHRNTSVSMVDFSVAVEVGPGRGRARPTARARRGCCRTAGLGLSPPPG